MRRSWTASILAIVTVLASVSGADARATSQPKAAPIHEGNTVHPRTTIRGHVAYAPASTRHKAHFIDLVGDPDSGYGFYPLPVQYRIGAWRYRQRYQVPPWLNPLYSTIAADAIRTPGWIPANAGYRYGVFNPIDGVGTPFFAGYYR